MDLDEDGRNGGNWHLAQQLAQLVIPDKFQQITYHVTLYILQQLAQHVIIQKQQIT